jgi:hypothetical protein
MTSTGPQQASTTVSVTPTNGKSGSMIQNAAGQMVYEQQGPFTDPALYAIPAGAKVVMSLPALIQCGTETNGIEELQVMA